MLQYGSVIQLLETVYRVGQDKQVINHFNACDSSKYESFPGFVGLFYSWENIADNKVHVWQFWQHLSGMLLVLLVQTPKSFPDKSMLFCILLWILLSLQATIGIDFLSKTMYLEDRTVRSSGTNYN